MPLPPDLASRARRLALENAQLHGGTPRAGPIVARLLASDAAEWITGAAIPMDGGNLAMNAGGGLLAPIMERYGARR